MDLAGDLLALHRSLGAQPSERPEAAAVESYGDVEREYRALTETCGLCDRSGRDLLRVTGGDRAAFLHGFVTNDIKGLAVGRGRYTAILTAKGKMIGDARVLCREGEILVDTEPGRGAPIGEFLNHHLISEDAEVADACHSLAVLSFLGPRALEAASRAVGQDLGHIEELELRDLRDDHADRFALGAPLGGAPGIDLFLPLAHARAFFERALEAGRPAGLIPVGAKALEVLRVEAGIPRFGPDMGEETIPLEANLAERAISFNKGCYVGQEVIARATFRGGVRRRLSGLAFDDGPLPPAGTELFAAGPDARPAAQTLSAVASPRFGPIALAYVRREHLAEGTELAVKDGRKARVRALPFRTPTQA